METVFLICAVVGGTVLVCQFIMAVTGLWGEGDSFDGDVDVDAADAISDPHGSTWLFGVLTFKTIVAALAFFGMAGMAASRSGQSQLVSMVIAIGAGAAAMYVMHWAMQSLYKLTSDGTERISGAVGKQGVVYLSIPGSKQGPGKVHMTLQNRLVEYQAMTSSVDRIPTGASVQVVGVLGPDLLEVEPAAQPAPIA